MCKGVSDRNGGHSLDTVTRNSITHLRASLVPKPSHMCEESLVLLVTFFVIWDRVTLKFESSNHIAESIIILA